MLHSNLLLKAFVLAALFCTLINVSAAQEKSETPASSSAASPANSSPDAAQMELAPGILPPTKGIVWILDNRGSKPELVRIYRNNALVNMHRGSNFARAQLFMKEISTLELSEPAARQRILAHSPVIFVRRTMEDEETLESAANGRSAPATHYVLLRMPVIDGHRVVCEFSIGAVAGKPARREEEIEISTEKITAGEWVKITTKQDLPVGEYALVRMPDDKTEAESFAFDFGIGAPAVPQPSK
jgi:hypothetical protein